jgi:hypothetical protein
MVIVLGAVVTMIATSLVILGIGHSKSALSEFQSASAKVAADSCADEALKQIRLSSSFTGSGNLVLSNSTCTYAVTNNSTASVTSVGLSGNSTRRVTIDISARTPSIIFTKWQEE